MTWQQSVASLGFAFMPWEGAAEKSLVNATESVAENLVVHGNSLNSTRPTWGYKLFSNDGTFLKNGITSRIIPETRYTKAFMSDKYMITTKFANRRAAYNWEFNQNMTTPGILNFERYIKR